VTAVRPHREQTISQLADGLRHNRWTASELVEESLSRIRATQSTLNAFVASEDDRAITDARNADRELRAGRDRGLLHGVPFAVKDIMAVAGTHMRAGSAAYNDLSTRDAAVVQSLREGGGVLVGRTRLHEIAFGATGVNAVDGGARNPWDSVRIPGGSSSGSAVAVAAGICPVALGTDTGGSCRIPAAFCGVVGYKPTYGLVPIEGIMPLSPTLDHVGILALSVDDVRTLLAAVTRGGLPAGDIALPRRIGLVRESLAGADAIVHAELERALRIIARDGTAIIEVELAASADSVAEVAARIMFYEAYRVHESRLRATPERFGADVRARLEEGAGTTSENYAAALNERHELQVRAAGLFSEVDMLVSPTVPIVPPRLEEVTSPPVRSPLARNTRLHNVLGVPAINLPIPGTSLPVGLQIAAPFDADARLLGAAVALERRLNA